MATVQLDVLADYSVLLLMTDGVTDVLSPTQLSLMVAAHATAVNVAQLANRIVADAHAAEAEKNRDDATVAVVWCQRD